MCYSKRRRRKVLVWRVRGSLGGVICLCQDDDEGARRKSSAVHLLASGGNTLTLALPSPSRLMTRRVGPGSPAWRTLLNLVTVLCGATAQALTETAWKEK